MEKVFKYSTFLSVLLACIIFLSFKQLKNNNWNRCIGSDGKGYYAYLPAFFIYQNTQFEFVDLYESKYYKSENYVKFTNEIEGKNVNKYWMGTALLMSPFFLTAHFLAHVLNQTTDGYSFIYQMMVAVAASFYLLLGLYYLRKLLLLLQFKEQVILIASFTIVFASNLFYYTVAEPSMSHVYSFSLICMFAYFAQSFFQTFENKYFNYLIIALAIITLIRPTNILVILSLPFFSQNLNNFKTAFSYLKPKKIFSSIFAFFALLSLQIIYYKLAVGSYFIYSYSNEHFNFLQPHLNEFLFSYRRGLFLYAPILLIASLGLVILAKKSIFQSISLFLFLVIITYVLSSWWMWYYGGGFGMRPMIDFFAFFAILLSLIIQTVYEHKWPKQIMIVIFGCCIMLSQIQTYQKVNFIMPWDGVNKDIYWKIFLKTNKDYIGKYKGEFNAQ
ncbi:MAG TPA: hypothetical protein PK323_00360 [Bacteroidia bacterium]|nr:hypothetical protein [Bacteroidia bacterium]